MTTTKKKVFGRPAAAVVGMNLLFDYHIGAAAIARSFAGYLRNLVSSGPEGSEGTHWIEAMPISGILSFNVIAPILLAALTFVLCRGVSEGAMLNRVLTGTKIATIAVVVLAGFSRCNFDLWTPLFPQGAAPVAAQV
jgi:basic amino acid/polyamine antiporter, APA family